MYSETSLFRTPLGPYNERKRSDQKRCSHFRGSFVQLSMRSVIVILLIKGGVLISGVFLYTFLYVAGTMHSVLIKRGFIISGVS